MGECYRRLNLSAFKYMNYLLIDCVCIRSDNEIMDLNCGLNQIFKI